MTGGRRLQPGVGAGVEPQRVSRFGECGEPCRRPSQLTGFAGGLSAKRKLLELEGLSGDWTG